MYRTGETIYEQILSLDEANNPLTGATFSSYIFRNGSLYTGATVSISLVHGQTGTFSSSWSASTTGDYQLILVNNSSNVIFESDIYRVRPDSEFDQTIYIGL